MYYCTRHFQPAQRVCAICGQALCPNCSAVEQDGTWACAAHALPGPAAPLSELRPAERLAGAGVHLCSLLNFVLPLIGGTLAIWLLRQLARDSEFVQEHGREAASFQVFYFIAIASLAGVLAGQWYCLICAPPLILLGLYLNLRGALHAWAGLPYRYPLTTNLKFGRNKP